MTKSQSTKTLLKKSKLCLRWGNTNSSETLLLMVRSKSCSPVEGTVGWKPHDFSNELVPMNPNNWRFRCSSFFTFLKIWLMEEILHQLIWQIYHYLQGFSTIQTVVVWDLFHQQ